MILELGALIFFLSNTKKSASKTTRTMKKFADTATHNKVLEISKRLGINPDWLYFVMNSESGLNPKAFNPTGGANATGLIQFMPSTAIGLGTTVEKLYQMTAFQQLDYVEKYYTPYKKWLKGFESMYLTTFYPAALVYQDNPNHVIGSDPGSIAAMGKTWPQIVARDNLPAWRETTGVNKGLITIGKYFEWIRKNK
jgi:hypothetical protein